MNDSSTICLSCGLCCNGTLIGFVQLNREEMSVLRELMEIENVNGKGIFLQPCNNYCDGCTIYSKRPNLGYKQPQTGYDRNSISRVKKLSLN